MGQGGEGGWEVGLGGGLEGGGWEVGLGGGLEGGVGRWGWEGGWKGGGLDVEMSLFGSRSCHLCPCLLSPIEMGDRCLA